MWVEEEKREGREGRGMEDPTAAGHLYTRGHHGGEGLVDQKAEREITRLGRWAFSRARCQPDSARRQ